MSIPNSSEEHHTYQIGTVATLTGIDPHTIRAWERRYEAIAPSRTETGRRRYDDRTVERLHLLKALVDANDAIGAIANLSDETLRGRLAKLADREFEGGAVDQPRADGVLGTRVAVLGAALEAQIAANPGEMPEFAVTAPGLDPDGFRALLENAGCDVALMELESLAPTAKEFVSAVECVPNRPLVVVLYRFGTRGLLRELARSGAVLVKMPIRLAQLRRIILDQLWIRRLQAARPEESRKSKIIHSRDTTSATTAVESRRFDDRQLARLLEISTSIDCECPNHVSSIVSALVAFENYSISCESKDEADAVLHRRLAKGTGRVRARMENLLVELCEHEGIRI
jgi:DNA-binding transcriptional MerR regulator